MMDSPPPSPLPPPPPPLHQRHWPLDLPSGLPFERYEHRRLTARDILVHRIMTALFAPAKETRNDNSDDNSDENRNKKQQPLDKHRQTLSAALATPRQPASRIEISRSYDARLQTQSSKMRTSIPYHNFAGLKVVDRMLARDIEVLRKMLVTRSPSEWVQQDLVKPAKAVAAWPGLHPPVTTCWERYREPPLVDQRPSVEEEVLALVRMHYLEIDDPVTRLWLGMVDMPRRSAYQTLQRMTAKQDTHKVLVQERLAWQERNEAEDYKRWYKEETVHLKALQNQTHVASERSLYEGGAFLPRLQRKVMQSKVSRAKFLNNMMEVKNQSYFTDEHNGQQIQDEVYPWPEGDAPRRILHVPSVYSWRQKQHFFRSEMPPVDFASGRTGRGLDRDGIWSTGRWYGDDVPRGRTTRRARRRAASEPPPESFTTARLPASFNSTRELLIFPKMSLSAMERRTRRRSLSRTRIAEMFNWDITLEDPPGQPPVRPQMVELLASPPKHLARRLNYTSAIQQPTPSMEKYSALWAELYHRYELNQLSADAIIEAVWAAAGNTSDFGAYPCPKWLVDIDGGEHVEVRKERSKNGDAKFSLYLRHPHPASPSPPCVNCCSTTHEVKQCRLPCGFCGAPNPNVDYKHVDVARSSSRFLQDDDADAAPKAGRHDNPHLAFNCPVARHNRCKCTPFPQFHVAAKCLVLCSRPCGNTAHPPGHFKHRNAMGCANRCCVCGLYGHSGIKCNFKTCRCGGKHLGQDCTWQPACHVAGCHRFHCGVHCRACGADWHVTASSGCDDIALVRGLCDLCSIERGMSSAAATDAQKKGKTGKARQRKRRQHSSSSSSSSSGHRLDARKATKEKKTWYAPLALRTRPVVGTKSGKSAAKWNRMDGEAEMKIGNHR